MARYTVETDNGLEDDGICHLRTENFDTASVRGRNLMAEEKYKNVYIMKWVGNSPKDTFYYVINGKREPNPRWTSETINPIYR